MSRKSTSNVNCVVFGCCNTYGNTRNKNPPVIFYSFPTKPWETDRRSQWIAFVNKTRKGIQSGDKWEPTKYSRICSDHFYKNKFENNKYSLSFIPQYHPSGKTPRARLQPSSASLARTQRAQNRSHVQTPETTDFLEQEHFDDEEEQSPKFKNQKCQTIEALLDNRKGDLIMNFCFITSEIGVTQINHKICSLQSTPITKDVAVGSNQTVPFFFGYLSMELDKDGGKLRHLTGLSQEIFDLLTEHLKLSSFKPISYRIEDWLLIFLIKLRHALSFTLLGSFFGISPATVGYNFYEVLNHLYFLALDYIYWPPKEDIIRTMPQCFKDSLPNEFCRVVIDCTEVKCQVPSKVINQNLMYSHYKSTHTIKFLIGISPNGFISYFSKAYGGRSSDTFITNVSGFLSHLSPGDSVLADKGFPMITVKDVLSVIPPRKPKDRQFSVQELERSQSIARVRIHVERVIQRLKTFKILSHTFPLKLLPSIDKIATVCAALVNLQPPILKPSTTVNIPGLTTTIETVSPNDEDEDDQEEDRVDLLNDFYNEEEEEEESKETFANGFIIKCK